MQFLRFQTSVTRIAVLSFTRRGAIDDFHRWAWQRFFFYTNITHCWQDMRTYHLDLLVKTTEKRYHHPKTICQPVGKAVFEENPDFDLLLPISQRSVHTNLFYQSVVTRWFPILINLSEKTWNNGLLDMIVVPGIVCIVLPASASLSRRPPRSDRFFHTLPNTQTHYSVCNCLLTMLLIDKSTQKWEQHNASASRSPGRPISSLLVNMFLIRS